MDVESYIKHLEESVKALDRSADVLTAEATTLREDFWKLATAGGEKAHYSFNVVKQGPSVRIRWARMTPLRKAGGEVARVVPKYLKVNKGESYPAKVFTDATPRELTLIVTYEPQLSLIRSEMKKNRAIRQLLSRRITESKKQL